MRTHRRVGAQAGRLTVSGPYFVDDQGQIVIRRSITAFCLPKRYATGRADEARAYLDYIARKGLNEGRIFTQVDWTGPPGKGVESGWAFNRDACAQALTDAAARGLRLELVAHTWAMDPAAAAQHLQAVDELCLEHDNALLEVWNEIWVNGGNELLADVLRRYTPRTPGWASGANPPPLDPAPGQSITYHSPRKPAAPRCFKDAYEFFTGDGPNSPFAPPFIGPVMLDEPAQIAQTGFMQSEDDWEAYCAGAALFAAGATIHDNPGLQQCTVPESGNYIDRCIDAGVRGFAAVPVLRYHGYNRGDPPTPSDDGSRRYWRWDDAGAQYEITVRPYSFRRL